MPAVSAPARRRTSSPHCLLRAVVLGLVAIVALAGCIRVDLSVELYEDNTAGGSVVFAIEDAAARDFGMDPAELIGQFEEDMAGNWPAESEHEPYAEDGYTGSRLIFPVAPLTDLYNITGQPLSVVRDGDEFVISGELNLTDVVAQQGVTDTQLLDNMTVTVSITCPGPVRQSNGVVSGNTITWTPATTGENLFSANCSAIYETPLGDDSPWVEGAEPAPESTAISWWIPALGVLLLGALAWLGYTLRRRSHHERGVEELGLEQFNEGTDYNPDPRFTDPQFTGEQFDLDPNLGNDPQFPGDIDIPYPPIELDDNTL